MTEKLHLIESNSNQTPSSLQNTITEALQFLSTTQADTQDPLTGGGTMENPSGLRSAARNELSAPEERPANQHTQENRKVRPVWPERKENFYGYWTAIDQRNAIEANKKLGRHFCTMREMAKREGITQERMRFHLKRGIPGAYKIQPKRHNPWIWLIPYEWHRPAKPPPFGGKRFHRVTKFSKHKYAVLAKRLYKFRLKRNRQTMKILKIKERLESGKRPWLRKRYLNLIKTHEERRAKETHGVREMCFQIRLIQELERKALTFGLEESTLVSIKKEVERKINERTKSGSGSNGSERSHGTVPEASSTDAGSEFRGVHGTADENGGEIFGDTGSA